MSKAKTIEQEAGPVCKPASDDTILKVGKEIIVKFIEVGRLSPANFDETFKEIYNSVHDTVRNK